MFKPAIRVAAFAPLRRALPKPTAARRFVSTAPPHRTSRSWRNSALRWGAAGAFVYYYNTTTVFAEEPTYAVHAPPETESEMEPTVAQISDQRRAQTRAQPQSHSSKTHSETVAKVPDGQSAASGSPAALEEEASEEGAFNEETGEINWDCPCLGGMAYGPCGEQFRAAFSCFVFSKEEPKGMDCIEHFKTMQGCFREHPEVYGNELEDDEAPQEESDDRVAPVQSEAASQPTSTASDSPQRPVEMTSDASSRGDLQGADSSTGRPQQVQSIGRYGQEGEKALSESEELMPKSWHDAREAPQSK